MRTFFEGCTKYKRILRQHIQIELFFSIGLNCEKNEKLLIFIPPNPDGLARHKFVTFGDFVSTATATWKNEAQNLRLLFKHHNFSFTIDEKPKNKKEVNMLQNYIVYDRCEKQKKKMTEKIIQRGYA